jgi:hypothetical protein
MRYLFAIHLDEAVALARPLAEVRAGMASHAPYIEMLRQNACYVGADPLEPAKTARTVRASGAQALVTEGPYAESREQFGGYYLVEALDLDRAIALAQACPALATPGVGAIEVRPSFVALTRTPAQPAPAGVPGAKRFLLSMYGGEHPLAGDGDEAAIERWRGFADELCAAGRFAGGELLTPSESTTTLRREEGHALTLVDGPYGPAARELVGYFIVWAGHLAEAVSLVPRGIGEAVEVRGIRSTVV